MDRESKSDLLFSVVNYIILSVFLVLVLYPIVYVLAASFSSPRAIIAGRVWLWPVDFSLLGYERTLAYQKVWMGFGNSFFYAIFGTILNIAMTVLAAYPLSRKDLKGRDAIMFLFAFTMWFSGGLIPSYLLVRKLGMINTRWALLIPNAMAIWNVIITRTFFQTQIPQELRESADMDGCDDFRFVGRIVLPLSGAIIAVNALFYAVGHWNAFFGAFLYLSDKSLFPLQIVLREVLLMGQTDDMEAMVMDAEQAEDARFLSELLRYSLIVVSSLPVVLMYPFVQKYFVKGIMIGAIKG